ncbi:MAG: hypothetical protein ICV51_14755, partial [Flavisolibacter sp.]|nr:hypothetical protein [Flavisolibacter sp.]
MVPAIRKEYNQRFTEEAYQQFLTDLNHHFPGQLDFRVAETPVFVPKDFTQKMLDACAYIIDVIRQPAYKQQSEKAIPPQLCVPNEDSHSHFIAFDFGICRNEQGAIEPQLIEMQGFPTIFAYQVLIAEIHKKHFWWPAGYDCYL